MFCTTCGKKLSSGAEFCTGCGKKVSGIWGSYFWLFIIIKWIGYLMLFFYMFLGVAGDIYYFSTSQTFIAVSILTGLLLIIFLVILQNYIKLLRYPVMGLLALSILVGLGLLGMKGYSYLTEKPSSLAVTVFKGPVSGATVNIYELDANGGKGNLIAGPLTSDASGNVNFDLPANLPKRFFIESKGGSYQSEATSQRVQLKDTDILTAVLSAGTKTAAVTPFTHMAVALAQARIQAGATPSDAVISANEDIAKQYGVNSILSVPVDATLQTSDSADSEAKQYGLLLAGFAQLAKNLDVRSIDLADALASDWSDGTLDGQQNGQKVVIAEGPALGNAGTTGLDNAKNQFAKSGKAFSTKEASTTVTPSPTPVTSGLTITTKSLPAWVSGQQGKYALTTTGGSAPVTWSVKSGGLPPGFNLTSDGIISGAFSLPSGPSGLSKKIFPDFTLEAKDQKGDTKIITLSITVVAKAPRISVYNPPTLTVGQSYEEVIATADEGIPPYEFYREVVSGPMPIGMQITTSGNNAVLSGSPKAKGSFSFRVCVVDSASAEKCGSVAFAVKDKEVAAPMPAPAKDIGWKGEYTGISVPVASNDILCNRHSSKFTLITGSDVIGIADWLGYNDYKNNQGVIDSSGFSKWEKQDGPLLHVLDLQFYKSEDKAYAKGTYTLIQDYNTGFVLTCVENITVEREE